MGSWNPTRDLRKYAGFTGDWGGALGYHLENDKPPDTYAQGSWVGGEYIEGYGQPGHQWGPDAQVNERYGKEHRINPETGALEGPLGLVPWGLGLAYQAQHDRAVWNARYRMGRDALSYAQGANTLLQSYRPGGAAAMEAGTYGQMAQIQMQRAQMHQPLDLLSDYRRKQISKAAGAGKKEQTIGAVLQGVGAIASLIPGVGAVAGPALMAAGGVVAGQGNAKAQSAAAAAQAGGSTYSANLGGFGAKAGQGGQAGQPGVTTGGQAQPGAPAPGQIGPQPLPSPTGGPPGVNRNPENDPNFVGPPRAQQAQMGGPGQPGGAPGGGPGGAPGGQPGGAPGMGGMAGAGGGMAAPVVGAADRDFSPAAYAQHAAATSMAPMDMQIALTEHYVSLLEQDEMLNAMPYAIDREFALRGVLV